MIKGIFIIEKITKQKIEIAQQLGFNTVFTNYKNLSKPTIKVLKEKNLQVFVEVGIFPNLCPCDKEAYRIRLRKIREIIKNLSLGGLWLDFIRFPLVWEMVNPQLEKAHICSKCQEVQDRKRIISHFVFQTFSLIKQNGKNLKLGMFAVPWQEADFNGAITQILGQDFKRLKDYIDIFSPMTYQKMCGKDPEWIHQTVKYMDKITSKPILPIVQTEDKPEKITAKEFSEEIIQALKPPSAGAIIFFLEDLLKNSDKLRIVKEIFK